MHFTEDMGVSKNSGTPKSSISIGFSIINHPFWGTPFFGNTHMMILSCFFCVQLRSLAASPPKKRYSRWKAQIPTEAFFLEWQIFALSNFQALLGGGFKYFLCSPRTLGKMDPF